MPMPAPANGPTAELLATAPQKWRRKSTSHRGPSPTIPGDAVIVAALRGMSPDNVAMPTRMVWDATRGSLPHSLTLSKVRSWAAWAELAGLQASGKARQVAQAARAAALKENTTEARVAARKAAAAAARQALLEAARDVLHTLAADGHMPRLVDYDRDKPADLPLGGELLQRLDLPSWGELAAAVGLAYDRHNGTEGIAK